MAERRRGHREGSIYYMPERDRWVVEISISTGKRKKFYCKTKQEAIKKKNEVLRELEGGTLARGPQRKLKDYLEDWIENVHKDNIRISMGIHPKVIQEMLGHSNISITLGIYGHLFPSMQQDVVEKWQDVFGEKREDKKGESG
ncbi:MAG TPA: hypothetical protein VKY19_00070 [Ktedonosporobacter sp.]|jgi:integrase|nr:hypothetical protein [Ktedonosporobacter sp.]